MKVLEKLPFQIRLFLILAVIITFLCGLVFASSQQVYRQSANDPQIQVSEDMAHYLSSGRDVQSVMPSSEVDIAKSLVWFLIIYDDSGDVVASNARLDGQTPVLPKGVLDHARQIGQNRVTWEPKEGVRVASVVTRYEGGFVLAGRSLRLTEERVEMLGKKVFIAWLVTLTVTFLGTWFLIPNLKKSH